MVTRGNPAGGPKHKPQWAKDADARDAARAASGVGGQDWNLQDRTHGVLHAVELTSRNVVHLCADKIVAVMALKKGGSGPARIFFVLGGHMDVCGSAEVWWRLVRTAQLSTAAAAPP